jgi:hypothetical protein
MQKRLALLSLSILLVLALVPAYYQMDDDALQGSSSCDAFNLLFSAVTTTNGITHSPEWTYASFYLRSSGILLKDLPSTAGTRGPPA